MFVDKIWYEGTGRYGGHLVNSEDRERLDPEEKADVPEVAPVTSTASTVTDDSAAKAAAEAEAERLRKKKGYKSTILTEDNAMMTQAPTQKAELLG
jgi:hypothetical protein